MGGKQGEEGRQSGGVLGMFWGVVGPYGQNETDSKIVTTNGTPCVRPAFLASSVLFVSN